MEIIYFLLLMIILMLFVLIMSIVQLNKNIIKLYHNLDNKLSLIRDTIINIHPGYKYKQYFKK